MNKIKGFDTLERQQWERARIHAHICVSPYMGKKVIPIIKLWPLPWDKELTKPAVKDLEKQGKQAHEKWKYIDAQKALKNNQ
ncbi:MAG: hypothetical protein GY940_24225 [bacterium]|nr:hypothetical protein [bacterium]